MLRRPVLGRLGELGWCVARQFCFSVVRREEFQLMRASWYFTHRLDASLTFDFMEYMLLSMARAPPWKMRLVLTLALIISSTGLSCTPFRTLCVTLSLQALRASCLPALNDA